MSESKITSGYEPLKASDLEAINLVRSYQSVIDGLKRKRANQLRANDLIAYADMEFSSFLWPNRISLRAYYWYGDPRQGNMEGRDVMLWEAENMFEAYANGTLESKLKEFVSLLEAELNIPPEDDVELKLAEDRRRAHSE